MSKITLKYYTDPGHGWVAVKRTILRQYGVAANISPYSYQKGDTVYLEEDRDADILIANMRARGAVVELKEKHTDRRHPIRSYETYKV